MQKIRLKLEMLSVESFETHTSGGTDEGTVHGYNTNAYQCQMSITGDWRCGCNSNATCYGSCQATCQSTCAGPTCVSDGCEGEPTLWVTCVEGCYWTDGVNACIE
jgi:hypothetical protein